MPTRSGSRDPACAGGSRRDRSGRRRSPACRFGSVGSRGLEMSEAVRRSRPSHQKPVRGRERWVAPSPATPRGVRSLPRCRRGSSRRSCPSRSRGKCQPRRPSNASSASSPRVATSTVAPGGTSASMTSRTRADELGVVTGLAPRVRQLVFRTPGRAWTLQDPYRAPDRSEPRPSRVRASRGRACDPGAPASATQSSPQQRSTALANSDGSSAISHLASSRTPRPSAPTVVVTVGVPTISDWITFRLVPAP